MGCVFCIAEDRLEAVEESTTISSSPELGFIPFYTPPVRFLERYLPPVEYRQFLVPDVFITMTMNPCSMGLVSEAESYVTHDEGNVTDSSSAMEELN